MQSRKASQPNYFGKARLDKKLNDVLAEYKKMLKKCNFLLVMLYIFYMSLSCSNANELCAENKESVYLVFIDRTTKYDKVDKEDLANGIIAIFDELHYGDRLIIYTIADSFSNSAKGVVTK